MTKSENTDRMLHRRSTLFAKTERYQRKKKRKLGECLLISSKPCKALRMLVDIARLAERFNMRSQSRAW